MLYELMPKYRKSFYGKAVVDIAADGTETLYSYNTPILKRSKDGTLTRLWSGWSATTGSHIAAFCGLNKAQFCALPCFSTPEQQAAAYSGTLVF